MDCCVVDDVGSVDSDCCYYCFQQDVQLFLVFQGVVPVLDFLLQHFDFVENAVFENLVVADLHFVDLVFELVQKVVQGVLLVDDPVFSLIGCRIYNCSYWASADVSSLATLSTDFRGRNLRSFFFNWGFNCFFFCRC